VLDARGLADDLIATGTTARAVRAFGGVQLDLSRLPTRFPFVLVTPQYHTERLLTERAAALGAEIVHGAEVVGLRQDADGVEVDVRAGDGTTRTRRAAYAVGADGVRSAVRRVLGLPFPGRAVVRSMMLADVRLDDAPTDVLTANATGDAFALVAPFGDGWYRVIAWDRRRQLPDDAPVDFDELGEVTRRALGTDAGLRDPRWMSRFHSDERQVPSSPRRGTGPLRGDTPAPGPSGRTGPSAWTSPSRRAPPRPPCWSAPTATLPGPPTRPTRNAAPS
jgi:2-polyprenyl-6-methoxyphenol hydroxylase-like FAD-dependent oxidoreductase